MFDVFDFLPTSWLAGSYLLYNRYLFFFNLCKKFQIRPKPVPGTGTSMTLKKHTLSYHFFFRERIKPIGNCTFMALVCVGMHSSGHHKTEDKDSWQIVTTLSLRIICLALHPGTTDTGNNNAVLVHPLNHPLLTWYQNIHWSWLL